MGQDRIVLGEAIEKSLGRKYEADVRRRADACGSRAAAEQNLHTAAERQQARQQVSERNVVCHGTTTSELRKMQNF